jgi:CheY-like chemotaxis protein
MMPITSPKKTVSILYVEDDATTLEIQSSMLTAMFPDVVLYTADSGVSGLNIFKELTPDIVISDINMSEMSGIEMSKIIRSIKPNAKIIAATGKSENLLQASSGNNDLIFDHHIVKPIILAELHAVIKQCIDEIVRD